VNCPEISMWPMLQHSVFKSPIILPKMPKSPARPSSRSRRPFGARCQRAWHQI
jgi:hypothetical protein